VVTATVLPLVLMFRANRLLALNGDDQPRRLTGARAAGLGDLNSGQSRSLHNDRPGSPPRPPPRYWRAAEMVADETAVLERRGNTSARPGRATSLARSRRIPIGRAILQRRWAACETCAADLTGDRRRGSLSDSDRALREINHQ